MDRLALTEVDGERLTDWEAASTLVLLVVAGHETTTNAIGNTIRLLVEEPGLLEKVQADRSLAGALVEESLRLDPPVTALPRKTRCPVTVDGTAIGEGEVVLLHMGAGNRDPGFTPDPDACVLGRDLPGPHLAFGFGIHLCLGAALAARSCASASRRCSTASPACGPCRAGRSSRPPRTSSAGRAST